MSLTLTHGTTPAELVPTLGPRAPLVGRDLCLRSDRTGGTTFHAVQHLHHHTSATTRPLIAAIPSAIILARASCSKSNVRHCYADCRRRPRLTQERFPSQRRREYRPERNRSATQTTCINVFYLLTRLEFMFEHPQRAADENCPSTKRPRQRMECH